VVRERGSLANVESRAAEAPTDRRGTGAVVSIEIDLPGATLRIDASSSTSIGRVRSVNEDSLVAASPVFAVADGMGGHSRGDRASQEIVRVLGDFAGGGLPSPEDVLDAIRTANRQVRALAEEDGPDVISGSTLAGVSLVATRDGDGAYWMAFNVGDSRIYEWDGRRLAQLSVDHSLVQELVDGGFITADEARSHPDRNVVTRAIGGSAEVDVDVWLLPVATTRTFLICSDGLTKELDDERIAGLLAGHADSEPSVAHALVAAAEAAGGTDNISVVVVEAVGAAADEDETRERLERTIDRLEDTRPRV
jgi:PPM family protein phosphatase